MFSKSAGSCLSHFKHLRYSSVHSKVSKRTRLNINISKGRLYATTTNAPNEGGSQDPDTYCREFVRQHDRDSFLTSQFFPKNLQHACFAVRAFCVSFRWSDSRTDGLFVQVRTCIDPRHCVQRNDRSNEDAILGRCITTHL